MVEGRWASTCLNAFDRQRMIEACVCASNDADDPVVHEFITGTHRGMVVEVSNVCAQVIPKFPSCNGPCFG